MDRQSMSNPALSNLKLGSCSQFDTRMCFVQSTSWILPAVLHAKSVADMTVMADHVGSDRWSGSPSWYFPTAMSNNFSNFSMLSWNYWNGFKMNNEEKSKHTWATAPICMLSSFEHTNIWTSFLLCTFWCWRKFMVWASILAKRKQPSTGSATPDKEMSFVKTYSLGMLLCRAWGNQLQNSAPDVLPLWESFASTYQQLPCQLACYDSHQQQASDQESMLFLMPQGWAWVSLMA